MPGASDAVEVVANAPHQRDRLPTGDFDRTNGVSGEVSTVASQTFQRLVAVRPEDFDLDLTAYESFPSDSTTGDTDTFDLGHYPMQVESAARDFVLYAGGDRVPDSEYSVDFDANSFDYSGDETADDLHAFYFSRQQTRYEIRKVAPNGTSEKLDEGDLSMANMADANETPLEFDYQHALQGVLPAYWTLEVRVDAPYQVAWGVDLDADGDWEATADQALLDVPLNRASESVPDWVSDAVASIAGAR